MCERRGKWTPSGLRHDFVPLCCQVHQASWPLGSQALAATPDFTAAASGDLNSGPRAYTASVLAVALPPPPSFSIFNGPSHSDILLTQWTFIGANCRPGAKVSWGMARCLIPEAPRFCREDQALEQLAALCSGVWGRTHPDRGSIKTEVGSGGGGMGLALKGG